jgi:hypothetical protein
VDCGGFGGGKWRFEVVEDEKSWLGWLVRVVREEEGGLLGRRSGGEGLLEVVMVERESGYGGERNRSRERKKGKRIKWIFVTFV